MASRYRPLILAAALEIYQARSPAVGIRSLHLHIHSLRLSLHSLLLSCACAASTPIRRPPALLCCPARHRHLIHRPSTHATTLILPTLQLHPATPAVIAIANASSSCLPFLRKSPRSRDFGIACCQHTTPATLLTIKQTPPNFQNDYQRVPVQQHGSRRLRHNRCPQAPTTAEINAIHPTNTHPSIACFMVATTQHSAAVKCRQPAVLLWKSRDAISRLVSDSLRLALHKKSC